MPFTIWCWIRFSDVPAVDAFHFFRWADGASQATAEFQHKTKLFFQVGLSEGVFPGACHNFDVSPERIEVLNRYLRSGAMRFSAGREGRLTGRFFNPHF
jgi:hypothetical protein